MKILPIDFDNAVKQDWSAWTCLLQQAHLRERGSRMRVRNDYYLVDGMEIHENGESVFEKAMQIFDKHFQRPGDETKPELQQLRASLPIEI